MNEARLNAFLGKAINDLGAAVSAVLVSLGDALGYYRALAATRLTPAELAAKSPLIEPLLSPGIVMLVAVACTA